MECVYVCVCVCGCLIHISANEDLSLLCCPSLIHVTYKGSLVKCGSKQLCSVSAASMVTPVPIME